MSSLLTENTSISNVCSIKLLISSTVMSLSTRPTYASALPTAALTPKRQAKGKSHYPTAGLFSASLKMKIKIFFLLEIVRNDVKITKCNYFPSFPSYVNWQPPENRLCIGERARREMA